MLEDLKEIRNLLDKFIAKYETDAKNLFGEDYFKSPTEDLNKKPDKILISNESFQDISLS